MRVLLFAGLAEALGRRDVSVADGTLPATVGELETRLRQEQPALAGCSFRLAVNRRYAAAHEVVQPGDEVALIPPVSGG